ncbi:potassium transporter TrkH, partial [Pseudomonas aeruginosa]|nr:potassium transporter TrkH [Pseudomonas aeruginosa]
MSLSLLRLVGFVLGLFLLTLAASMLIPLLTLVLFQRYDDFDAFVWSSLLTAAAGLALLLPGRPAQVHFRARHMYFLTTASWVVVCAF